MHINNVSSTNFQGGFRFRNMPIKAQEALPGVVKKGKQIFYNFENPETIFLIVRDELNGKVFNFAKTYKLKFDYYSGIDTKCGLDTQKPESLTALIKDKSFDHIENAKKYCKKHHRLKQKEYEDKNLGFVRNILKTLFIDIDNPIITDKYGEKIIDDIDGKRRIYISPMNRDGIRYVLVDSTGAEFFRYRYAMKSSGKIVKKYTSIDDIKPFKETFNSLLKKS